MNIEETIEQRNKLHGDFLPQSEIAQNIKYAMRNGINWGHMEDDKREALEMIANKISRIVNGDHNSIDSWHDIIGYARLVEKRLKGENKA